jgi:transcription termination factor NusB
MLAESRREGEAVVYEGFLTRLITQQLNLSVPYYTKVRKALLRMGCIRQLRRGGGSSPSQWELSHEPDLDSFLKQEAPKVPKQDKDEATHQQILALTHRVAELESSRDAMIDAFAKHFGVEQLEDKDV